MSVSLYERIWMGELRPSLLLPRVEQTPPLPTRTWTKSPCHYAIKDVGKLTQPLGSPWFQASLPVLRTIDVQIWGMRAKKDKVSIIHPENYCLSISRSWMVDDLEGNHEIYQVFEQCPSHSTFLADLAALSNWKEKERTAHGHCNINWHRLTPCSHPANKTGLSGISQVTTHPFSLNNWHVWTNPDRWASDSHDEMKRNREGVVYKLDKFQPEPSPGESWPNDES